MLYSSLIFIYIFFPASLVAFFATPAKFKDISLFLLSLIFCCFSGVRFLAFMMIYLIVNYSAARITYSLKLQESKYKKISSIPFTIGILFDAVALLSFRVDALSWVLSPFGFRENFFPVGISFFTLSAVSCLADVYRGKVKSEITFVRFGLYIMLFSHVAICPYQEYDRFFMSRKGKVRMNELGEGMMLFVKGLAKKVIIADSLFRLCSDVRSIDVDSVSTLNAWFGAVAYIFCLYFTLSGLSDMATGLSCCFGFRYPPSFEYPLMNSKIRFFYTQWHITLNHWLRQYIVNPLCGIINDKYKSSFVPAFTLAFMGLFYTFSLNGLIWGFLMGFAIFIEEKLKNIKMLRTTGMIYSFLVTVILSAFLPFGSVRESLSYIWAMIGGNKIFADSLTFYFLRSYIIVILIALYASTNFFRNTIERAEKSKLKPLVSVVSPFVILITFIVCTALISYTGTSGLRILEL